MLKILFFIFIFTLLTSVFGKKYLCSLNETIKLEKNEFIFFENYAFPHQIISKFPCLLNISTIPLNPTEKLIIVFNAIDYKDYIREHFFEFLIFEKEFSTKILSKNKTKAVQGFAVSEDITEGCPLESISKDGPFELSDETEIIHLRSTFFQNQSRKFPCLWKFNSTIQYGFKIVFTNLTISSNTTVTVRNSTDAYIGNGMISLNHAYYNDDNYIEISLSLGDPDFKADLEFQAYISVVKKHYEIVDANCILRYDGPKNGTLWWYTNRYYPSNSRCSFDLVIQPNTAVLIGYEWNVLEENVDFIRYNIDGGGWIIFDGINFNIEGYKNDSTKNVWFEFVSDGSLQFWGFQLDLTAVDCQCADSLFRCKPEFSTGIMKSGNRFCSHMHCIFEFESCYGPYLRIIAYSYPGDVFTFKSNNQTVLEINTQNSFENVIELFLNPGSVNTMEANTLSGQVGVFSMAYVFTSFPIVKTHVLSNENLSFDYYANSEAVVLINISEELKSQNLSLTLYVTNVGQMQIYNNESLTFSLISENCFYGSSFYKCTLVTNQLAILFKAFKKLFDDQNPLFLALRIAKRRKGCILEENIFVASGDTHSIVGIADSEGECMIRLLITFEAQYLITYLWTTAKNDTVKIYAGFDRSHLLLQFNKETMTQWGNIGLFSAVYTIIIPKKSSLLMTIKRYYRQNLISQSPFKSVIATSYFGTLQVNFPVGKGNYTIISYNTLISPIKLTILHYNMLLNDQFRFYGCLMQKCGQLKVGDTLVFRNESRLQFWYNRNSITDGLNGIVFFVEPATNDEIGNVELCINPYAN